MHVFWLLLLLLTWLAVGLGIFSMSATSETLQDQDAVNSAVASFSGQQHHPVVRCDVKIGWITNFHLPSFAISWDLVMSIPLLHPLTVGIRAIYCWFVSSTFPEVDEISLPSLWSEQGSRPEILEAVQQWTREGSSSYRQQASWLSLHITQNMPNIYHIYIYFLKHAMRLILESCLEPLLAEVVGLPISLCKPCPLGRVVSNRMVDACNFSYWRWWCTRYQSRQDG